MAELSQDNEMMGLSLERPVSVDGPATPAMSNTPSTVDLESLAGGTGEETGIYSESRLNRAEPEVADSELAGVLDSIRSFEDELVKNRQEMKSQRELLELLGADTWSKRKAADERAFLENMRETFSRDPAQATSILIKKAQEQLWQAFESRLNEEARQKNELDLFIKKISSNPERSSMGNFRDEIEFLVRNKGLGPEESVGLIERISSKLDQTSDRKKAAIRKMRSESQFEPAQSGSAPNDPDREFTRLMSQAKNLDEMFANLRKVGS